MRGSAERNSPGAARGLALAAFCALGLSACASTGGGKFGAIPNARAYNRPYQVRGRWYSPADQPGYDVVGTASWYSYESPNRTTADGEPFDARLVTAAHRTLPIPSYLEVTNLANGRSLRVRLNDRGPFVPDRLIDLSRGAAEQLGFLGAGTARVRVRYLGPAPALGRTRVLMARASPIRSQPVYQPVTPPAAISRPLPPIAEAELASLPTNGAQVSEETIPPPAASGFSVQAAAFADLGNAERAVSRLGLAGPSAIRPLDAHGTRLYRVVVGPWADETDADAACARVAALGFSGARVVRSD